MQDSRDELALVITKRLVQELSIQQAGQEQVQLPSRKRGVIYVRSCAIREVISTALKCRFYKARVKQKGKLLKE